MSECDLHEEEDRSNHNLSEVMGFIKILKKYIFYCK